MPRRSKLEVGGVNLRIPQEYERDYGKLLSLLASVKRGVRVYGDSYVGISSFNTESGVGIFSKYSEIDVDGDWFDIEGFSAADAEDIEEINVPEKLRPNYAAFYFRLNSDAHVITFETYSESKNLSTRSVGKYFTEVLGLPEVRRQFGKVNVSVILSFSTVSEILNRKNLKELNIAIRKPNPDDIGENLAAEIEERLVEQKADEYEETLRSKDEDMIEPSDRTRRLALVAAENGSVRAKTVVNGVTTIEKAAETPQKEVDTYDKEEQSTRDVFLTLSQRFIERVTQVRQRIIRGDG